jgi:hypothetical protein
MDEFAAQDTVRILQPVYKRNQHTELHSLKYLTYQQIYHSIYYDLDHQNSTNLPQSIRTLTTLPRLHSR